MSTGKFIAGCVVGGVIGAIAGLLLAPQSGEETREAIKDVSRDVADKIIFMADGVIAEQGIPEQVINNPQNPRTQAFLSRFNH